MNNFMNDVKRIFAVTGLLMASAAQAAGPAAGTVTMANGRSTASDPSTGSVRALNKGDTVYSGEMLNTSANTYLNIRYLDGSYTLIRPNSRFEIADYRFEGTPAQPLPAQAATPAASAGNAASSPAPALSPAVQTGPSRAFFRLVKGGFRAVSGAIGKASRDEYQVRTPIATMGIRGTDYEVDICDAACQNDPVIRQSLERRGRAQLDGMQLAQALELAQSDVPPDSTPPEATEVVRVNEGSVNYQPENGSPIVIEENQNYLALPNGEIIPLGRQPGSLSKPNPAGASCN